MVFPLEVIPPNETNEAPTTVIKSVLELKSAPLTLAVTELTTVGVAVVVSDFLQDELKMKIQIAKTAMKLGIDLLNNMLFKITGEQ
jgi:hypothetical protein